jgi:hypothetical protein
MCAPKTEKKNQKASELILRGFLVLYTNQLLLLLPKQITK